MPRFRIHASLIDGREQCSDVNFFSLQSWPDGPAFRVLCEGWGFVVRAGTVAKVSELKTLAPRRALPD